MRVTAALSLSLLALLVGAGSARAGTDLLIGVHDDTIKWTERPAPILGAMQALGLGGMRMTLEWRPGKRHLTGPDHDALRRAVAAHRYGVRIVLGVYGRAVDAPREPAAREDYCRFVRNVVLRYGEIRDVVIWNEANSDTFWQPREGAPAAYAALLARCWDLLHASVPGVNVLTTTASSHDPAAFIRGDRRRLPRERPRAAALRRRRPQSVSALSRRVSDRPPRRLHRPGRLRPARGGPRRVLRRHGATGHADLVPRERLPDDRRERAPLPLHRPGERRATRSRRPSRRRSSRPRSGSRAASRASPRTSTSSSSTRSLLEGWQSGLLWADWKRKPAFAAYRAAIAEVRRGAVDCAAVLRG